MVLVSPRMNPTICCQFEAAIVLLFHAKTFRRGSQVTVHVGNVRQTAIVEGLQGKVSDPAPHRQLFHLVSACGNCCLCVSQEELRTGERAVVRFRFIKHPEYLRLGAKLLFREGVTKGIGHVTRLLPRPSPSLSPCRRDQNTDQNHNLQGQ